ncbi:universal stress protein [Salinigranum rubrum]|uniref:Universal stress protein n=1 Tax=Salinigranum rubrum TaxID=755307 RepID=A0A2I8VM54_9EURY|nr:universal stress protein [Salinigranum rubrum]AUV82998.1 universal stress protein [Salinigranum rubrum]
MYDEILIPTDGSDASEVAVEQGVAVAARFDARVHLLHVVDVRAEMAASGVGDIADDLTETLDTMASDALDAAEALADGAGVPYEREVLEGYPHDAIAEYAADNEVDLVVVGASGRSGVAEHLLGSTTERVARTVGTSVLIARA